ncbi:MAG: hypothetical protein SV686_11610 [Thermodesulfobacteriota bacterium]|nr:hypothetical protein [Thermodesulfobacteriota bacterium]
MDKKDIQRLRSAFERTPTLFRLLSTVRSRRVGAGYSLESGQPDTHGVTGRSLESRTGPLGFVSCKKPEPLSEVETALLCWAACGPNGIITGDIAGTHDIGTLMSFGGRTIPSAANDWCVDLIFTNDQGTFLYRPTRQRSKVIEIESEEDYPKIIEWFQEGLTQLSKQRLDIDWTISPGRPMGVWQYNLNRPGSTWFIPVVDIAKGMINLYFSVFEHMQWLITDDQTGKPCGLEEWAKPGMLELPITQHTYEEAMLHMADYQHGMLIQNLRLAAEAMGLGCWIFGGFCEDVVLGGFRPLAKGLRFRYRVIDGKRNYIGIPKVLEGFGMPAPWNKSIDDLINRVLALKKQALVHLPYSGKTDVDMRPFLNRGPSDWCIEAVKSVLSYLYERYGRFPVYYSAFHSNLHAQIHHLDPDFYDTYLKEGYIPDQHRNHSKAWHE